MAIKLFKPSTENLIKGQALSVAEECQAKAVMKKCQEQTAVKKVITKRNFVESFTNLR